MIVRLHRRLNIVVILAPACEYFSFKNAQFPLTFKDFFLRDCFHSFSEINLIKK